MCIIINCVKGDEENHRVLWKRTIGEISQQVMVELPLKDLIGASKWGVGVVVVIGKGTECTRRCSWL